MKNSHLLAFGLAALLVGSGILAMVSSMTFTGIKLFVVLFAGLLVTIVGIVLSIITNQQTRGRKMNFPQSIGVFFLLPFGYIFSLASAIGFLASIWLVLSTGGASGWIEFWEAFGLGFGAWLFFTVSLSTSPKKSFRERAGRK